MSISHSNRLHHNPFQHICTLQLTKALVQLLGDIKHPCRTVSTPLFYIYPVDWLQDPSGGWWAPPTFPTACNCFDNTWFLSYSSSLHIILITHSLQKYWWKIRKRKWSESKMGGRDFFWKNPYIRYGTYSVKFCSHLKCRFLFIALLGWITEYQKYVISNQIIWKIEKMGSTES